MTQVVTVHTDFQDLNQMTQGLIGRVNDSHVILPAGDPVDVGEWVQFAVTLFDGSPAFAGVGRCVTFVDNGEDRMPHQRFDVVFDSLQFDDRARQIYEHILSLSGLDVEPSAEELVDGSSSHSIDVSTDFSGASSVPAADVEDGDATVVASDSELRGALAESAVHTVDAMDVASDYPEAEDEEHPTLPPQPSTLASLRSNGAAAPAPYAARAINGTTFSYPDGLPFPTQPPRPELDPSQRVTPAPRPEH
jgi:hypothetical protein